MDDLIQRLRQFLGQDALVTDQMEREYYSMDAFSSGETCCLALKPKTKEQVEQSDFLGVFQKKLAKVFVS